MICLTDPALGREDQAWQVHDRDGPPRSAPWRPETGRKSGAAARIVNSTPASAKLLSAFARATNPAAPMKSSSERSSTTSLRWEIDSSRQSGPEVECGQTLDPAAESQHGFPSLERGHHPETGGIVDQGHSERSPGKRRPACAACHNHLVPDDGSVCVSGWRKTDTTYLQEKPGERLFASGLQQTAQAVLGGPLDVEGKTHQSYYLLDTTNRTLSGLRGSRHPYSAVC